MNSIDVVLLTKNSDRVLEKCLKSVYANVPVRQLIVVDGYSTDQTLSILKRFDNEYHNVKIIFDGGTRATARQKGIESVGTTWFLFVDSDVVLCRNWFEKAVKRICGNVGAVWGIEIWSTVQNPKTLKIFLWVTRKIFELRGGTHDTLVRSDLVKDIQIPTNLHVFEDAYIKDWITNKGYKMIGCYDPFCIHFRPQKVWTFRGSLDIIADAIRYGSLSLIAKLIFAYGFYAAYSINQLFIRNGRK